MCHFNFLEPLEGQIHIAVILERESLSVVMDVTSLSVRNRSARLADLMSTTLSVDELREGKAMNAVSVAAAVMSDEESLQDFIDALRDYAPAIERDVARLRNSPGEREVLGSLFRSLHNVKGDAALCKVGLAVSVVHPIESILARVRGNDFPFTDSIAEMILLAIDRVELAAARLVRGDALDGLQLAPLVNGLQQLAQASVDDIDEQVSEIIEAVTGFRPVASAALRHRGRVSSVHSAARFPEAEDLRFFQSLAQQLEARSPLFKGRTTRILRLCKETNQMAGAKIDARQLEAAVYMHDVGMMFLAESDWLKASVMTPQEKERLHNHPAYAAGLLGRIDHWEAAAEMVAQHHEMPDGRGYPQGLGGAQICPGAKLLAIVDAFEAVMLKHIDRGRNRSVLRAIAEINACDQQFAPEWIGPFNQVIRRSLEAA